jgi:type II secretory pathway component PulM
VVRADRLSVRSLGVVASLCSCAVLLGAWQAWLAPERLLRDAARSRLASAMAELARLRQSNAGLTGLRREVRSLEAKLAAAGPTAGPSDASAHVLDAVNAAAMQSGLALASFANRPSTDRRTDRVEFAADGSFHEVVAFLKSLVAAGLVATIHEIAIKPASKPDTRRIVTATIVAGSGAGARAFALDLGDAGTAAGRDPFLDPRRMDRAIAPANGTDRPVRPAAATLAAVPLDDVSVTGIVRAGGVMLATLQTSHRRTFVVRLQERLLDATVHGIDADGVVFVRDATRAEPVRKALGGAR